MRIIIALCSMLLLFSFTGIQAQTETVPAPSDTIQAPLSDSAPAQETPVAAENPMAKPVPVLPTRESLHNDGLKGTALFSCNGFYYYNKIQETDYDWFSGESYETIHKTYVYAVLMNGNYFVTDGFSIGGTLGTLTLASKSESDYRLYNFSHDNSYSISVKLIGPRLAYYHGRKDSKVLPFAAFEYDLITAENYNDTAIRIGAGILLQPKPHFGISFGLDYLKLGDEENSTNIIGVLGLTGIIY